MWFSYCKVKNQIILGSLLLVSCFVSEVFFLLSTTPPNNTAFKDYPPTLLNFKNVTPKVKPTISERLASHEYDPLRYIPASTVDAWRLRDFAVVFGIPSEDIEARRRRRNLQRATCWQYAGVARKENNYNGSMLVLYVLGRSPSHQYVHSEEMLQEAQQWHDIVALGINEGRKTRNKKIGEVGKWGFVAEVGVSRKTFVWFDLALRAFPRARYVAKGDDDMFLRVPQYLSDMQRLPPRGVYWGHMKYARARPFKKILRFPVAFGWTYTLESSVAEAFVSYKPLRQLIALPFTPSLRLYYIQFSLTAEDGMVGLAIKLSGYRDLFLVNEKLCRFHDAHEGIFALNITLNSVMVHHVREEEYEVLKKNFKNVKIFFADFLQQVEKRWSYFSC